MHSMQTSRFRPLINAKGPFVSVYVDDSHDTADAAKQAELRWRAVADELSSRGADADVIDTVREVLTESTPTVGRGGRAVLAGRDVRVTQHLIRAPEQPVVRVSDLPYLVPAIVHGGDEPPHLVVTVDHEGADLQMRGGGRPHSSTVEGRGYPVHKASGAESAGYGDPQRTAEGARQKNIQAVAESVTALVDDEKPVLVFIVGEVTSRSDLIKALPQRVADEVVEVNAGARGSVDDAQLSHDIDEALQLRRVDDIDSAAARFRAERDRNSGLATEGLDGVCAALRDGAVDTLILGDLGDATVLLGDSPTMVAPSPEVLSELGAERHTTARADEALPYAAVSTDASLIGVDERLTPRDGVAAILRFAPRTSA